MNVLSSLLDKAAAERKFGYHPRCKNMNLTHLCFADDIMVFSDGKLRSLDGILKVFTDFAAISGLQISLEKSSLYLAGISPSTRDELVAAFPFSLGSLPVRYLGLPLLNRRMSLSDCLPLIDKIRSRINSWKHRFLSYAGRLQLLKSVIASLTNFWISAFRLPSACIKEIEKICSAFLWSGPDLNTRKVKVSWIDVCRPKKEGGLGIKSLAEANKVCCFKLIWRIVSREKTLWVDWIYRELIRNGSFWNVKHTSSLGSWIWKKLLKYRDQAKEFHRMEVRSGKYTSFWFDHWSSMGVIRDLLGEGCYINLGLKVEATVEEAMRSLRRRGYRNQFQHQICEELKKLRDLKSREDDIPLWRRPNGEFKSSFKTSNTWEQIRRVGQVNEWHKGIWFSGATPKYSLLTWVAIQNRLTTGDRMQAWNRDVNSTCIFCKHSLETRDHLFFQCRVLAQIWETLSRNLWKDLYTTDFTTVLTLLASLPKNETTTFIIRYVFQATVHRIWWERNRRRHGELPTPLGGMIKYIDKMVRNRISSLIKVRPSLGDGLRVWFGSRD